MAKGLYRIPVSRFSDSVATNKFTILSQETKSKTSKAPKEKVEKEKKKEVIAAVSAKPKQKKRRKKGMWPKWLVTLEQPQKKRQFYYSSVGFQNTGNPKQQKR